MKWCDQVDVTTPFRHGDENSVNEQLNHDAHDQNTHPHTQHQRTTTVLVLGCFFCS